jgi:hypothetical protein
MASAKNDTKERSAQYEGKSEKSQALLQLLNLQINKIVLVMKKMTKIKRLL